MQPISLKARGLGSIYMGLDPFGTGMKLVWLRLVFTCAWWIQYRSDLLSGT